VRVRNGNAVPTVASRKLSAMDARDRNSVDSRAFDANRLRSPTDIDNTY